ncbi:MAG: cytochrome c [Hyphomicrobiales bacterium]
MLGLRALKTVTAVALFLGAGVVSASADATSSIQARQACMKANGGIMAVAVPMMKGEKPFDKAALDAAFAAENKACAGWADWWGEDTKPGGATETWAKDEVWTDKAGFDAAAGAYVKAATALAAATDEASFKAAFPELGNSCKGCHEKFRRPKG